MGEKHESSGSPRGARTADDARSRHRGGNPQVRSLPCLLAFHDPNAAAGQEMMEHTGLATGLEAIGEAFGPAASMIFRQAGTACTPSRPSSSQTLGR